LGLVKAWASASARVEATAPAWEFGWVQEWARMRVSAKVRASAESMALERGRE